MSHCMYAYSSYMTVDCLMCSCELDPSASDFFRGCAVFYFIAAKGSYLNAEPRRVIDV